MAKAEKEYLLRFEAEEDFQRARRFIVRRAGREPEPLGPLRGRECGMFYPAPPLFGYDDQQWYDFLMATRWESSDQFHRWPLCSSCKKALDWYFEKVLRKKSPVKGVCMEYLPAISIVR